MNMFDYINYWYSGVIFENFSKDLKVTVCYKGVANYHNTISVKISEIGKLN